MCLVETGTRNPETGAITMLPKLVPACQTPAKDGTVFVTNSEAVKKARAQVEEDLLLRHPIDCPICDKAGECYLQDYHFEHGQAQRRADIKPFTSRRRDMGDTVTLFVDRCVMCSRCVRFTREISGTSELMIINRGSHEEIDVFPGFPLANKLSGCVVDLCPVGALGDKDFLYKQRVWYMKQHEGVCAGCSTGCSIDIDENQDTVYRLKPRENMFVNKWWMCDEGRYGYHHLHSPERKIEPKVRGHNGQAGNIEWSQLPQELTAHLQKACGAGGRLAAVVSPFLTVEEAYLLCKLARKFDSQAVLALGPVPVVGKDETFPGNFTIHAEKCPNRKGVEEVLAHFCSGKIKTFDELLEELAGRADQSSLGQRRLSTTVARRRGGRSAGRTRIVDRARHVRFAAVACRHVSIARRGLRRTRRLVREFRRPPAIVHLGHSSAGRRVGRGAIVWQLCLGMRGLYNPRAVLSEIAHEIIAFKAAAGEIPSVGIDLRSNQLASAT